MLCCLLEADMQSGMECSGQRGEMKGNSNTVTSERQCSSFITRIGLVIGAAIGTTVYRCPTKGKTHILGNLPHVGVSDV